MSTPVTYTDLIEAFEIPDSVIDTINDALRRNLVGGNPSITVSANVFWAALRDANRRVAVLDGYRESDWIARLAIIYKKAGWVVQFVKKDPINKIWDSQLIFGNVRDATTT